MLSYYASRLPSVEINATFYGHPTEETVGSWVKAVPESFRFAVKAHHRITHDRRLQAIEGDLELFAARLSMFVDRLGPVLFQLPPAAAWAPGVLEGFLPLLRPSWRAAFQFRNPSWHTEGVRRTVERAGGAICHADGEPEPGPMGAGGSFLYFRLRRDHYSDAELDSWAERFQGYLGEGRDVFAYFKHEALGPSYAEGIARRLIRPLPAPLLSTGPARSRAWTARRSRDRC